MAAPSLEQWIEERGLQQVHDPDVGKAVYRKPFGGQVKLSAEFEAQISSRGGTPATSEICRVQSSHPCSVSANPFTRANELNVSRLTVGRLVHICEVQGATPEEIIAPAAPHLWGETETKAGLLLAAIEKLRRFDLRDVFSLLDRLGETGKSGHGGNGAASAAPLLSRAANPLKRGIGLRHVTA